jgi:hypothetical protein
MTTLSLDAQKTLEALKKAVADDLKRKQKLGHYAVIWRNGKPICIGEDAPHASPQQ